MTQMADEIRTLIADLYDDPEDFLKRPHQWFGERSPDELMVTEAGQSVLLEFIRGEYHRLTVEADPDFQPSPDHAIDQAIARLEEQVERLRSLKGSGPEIATVMGKVQEVFGERGVIWLVRPNRVLQATPLDLIKQGKSDRVLRLLVQIEHGVHP
jgi:uncharacterized protein (DUF2384 family)